LAVFAPASAPLAFADFTATTFYALAILLLMLAEFWDIAAFSAIFPAPLVLAHAILLPHCANLFPPL